MLEEAVLDRGDWERWLSIHTTTTSSVAEDFGLSSIAARLGKSGAVELYWQGASREQEGDVDGAIALYKKAFKQWPALDSVSLGGLPKAVREEAEAADAADAAVSGNLPPYFSSTQVGTSTAAVTAFTATTSAGQLLAVIDVSKARASKAVVSRGLLTPADLAKVEAVRAAVSAVESPLQNNPQNATHAHKVGTFLNNGPDFLMRKAAPEVVGKLIKFALQAWEEAGWGSATGPLASLTSSSGSISKSSGSSNVCNNRNSSSNSSCNGIGSRNISGNSSGCNSSFVGEATKPTVTSPLPPLSIRVIEHWEYTAGGGLQDPLHYDADSVLTIVALLADESTFQGGCFCTNEPDNSSLQYDMKQGDAICFVSHKYHSVTPVTSGVRKSLVIELWQGGTSHQGR